MLKNKKKSNNYFNNAGNEPSRFVVDLKEQFIEDEKVIEKDQKGMLNKLKLKELYKKYEELDIRDKVNKIKEKGKQPISIDKTKVKITEAIQNSQKAKYKLSSPLRKILIAQHPTIVQNPILNPYQAKPFLIFSLILYLGFSFVLLNLFIS